MNKYTQEYKEIVRELINKGFPSLKNKKIIISGMPWWFGYSAFSLYLFGIKWIAITRKVRNYSSAAKKGMLAHELMHLERNKRLSYFKLIYLGIMYYLSRKVYAREERATDLAVLKRGYVKELLQVEYEIEKVKTKEQISKRHKEGYLSIEEIKHYVKTHRIKVK